MYKFGEKIIRILVDFLSLRFRFFATRKKYEKKLKNAFRFRTLGITGNFGNFDFHILNEA
jgi:hypothetical protein